MSEKKKDTPEVEPWELKESSIDLTGAKTEAKVLEEIMRRSFREPILDDDGVTVEIKGKRYEVLDVGSRGIGINIPSKDVLSPGAAYEVTLIVGGKNLTLQGQVAHITPEAEGSSNCHCGIELTNMSDDAEKTLQEFLIQHHTKLFG